MAKATNEDSTKRAALSLLRQGLVTKSEAAELAGVSRQLMQFWTRDMGLETAREQHLKALWRRTVLLQ